MLRASLLILLILGSVLQPLSAFTNGHSFSSALENSVSTQDDIAKPTAIPNRAHCEGLNQFNQQECDCCNDVSFDNCSIDVSCSPVKFVGSSDSPFKASKRYVSFVFPPFSIDYLSGISSVIFHPPKLLS